MSEEKTVKVMCTRGWKCGFYRNFEDAEKHNFVFCTLCGCFLRGSITAVVSEAEAMNSARENRR